MKIKLFLYIPCSIKIRFIDCVYSCLLVSGRTGWGKTTFVKKILQSKCLERKIRHFYYCNPDSFDSPPIDWHTIPDLIVTYCHFCLTTNLWKIWKNSLIFSTKIFKPIKFTNMSLKMKIAFFINDKKILCELYKSLRTCAFSLRNQNLNLILNSRYELYNEGYGLDKLA